MSDEDWDSGFGKSVAVYLNGHGIPDLDARGRRVTDDSFVHVLQRPPRGPSDSPSRQWNFRGRLGSRWWTPLPGRARSVSHGGQSRQPGCGYRPGDGGAAGGRLADGPVPRLRVQ